ncbi:phytoene/squalene synthase family protein [Altererythrobacter sp. MF3-039]|uniref:phytoene/squalene synthase family protein n=1 Tax=Altererythrobacter sp. MF3-039 TaxID=3252901 RepID=UPI00390C5046
MLAPSRILRPTMAAAGGGRMRAPLVAKARSMIEKGSTSFTAASLIFRKGTRERVWLLYAWCRRCDDIADGQTLGGELGDQSDLQGRVRGIKALTRRALEGQPTADIGFDAFGQVASEVGLTYEDADEVIKGFELDANGWRPRTEEDLMRYCYHVAGAVGVLMARVMGVPRDSHEVLDRACDLGMAFQLANIARDLDEDDAADRCYLPQEWIARADIPPGEHMKPPYRFATAALAARLIDRMEQHEDAARLGAAHLRFRQRWAILSAARIYGAIGRKVRDRGQLAWNSRVYTSAPEKVWHVFAAFWEALVNRPFIPAEMPRYGLHDFASPAIAPPPPLDDEG